MTVEPFDRDGALREDLARERLVRLKAGQPSAKDLAELAVWRAADPRNEAAWRRAESTWSLLGEAPLAVGPSLSRRGRPLGAWATAAAGVAAVLVGLVAWSLPAGGVAALAADLRTAPGAPTTVRLSDGTALILDGATAIDTDLSGGKRRLRLITGQVTVEVAPGGRSPFEVAAGGMDGQTEGGRFVLSKAEGRVRLVVCSGGVRTEGEDLKAGQGRRWQGDAAGASQAEDASAADAWRRGRWVFRDAPLRDATDQIARATGQKIILIGPRANNTRLTAVVDSQDAAGTLRRLDASLPMRVLTPAPRLVAIL